MEDQSQKDSVRHTDANPEVKDASALEPTQEEQKEELAKHSELEQKTGVKPEELDTRPVVDTSEPEESFDERTQDTQPWKEYQKERSHDVSEEAKEKADELNARHETAAKEADKGVDDGAKR